MRITTISVWTTILQKINFIFFTFLLLVQLQLPFEFPRTWTCNDFLEDGTLDSRTSFDDEPMSTDNIKESVTNHKELTLHEVEGVTLWSVQALVHALQAGL